MRYYKGMEEFTMRDNRITRHRGKGYLLTALAAAVLLAASPGTAQAQLTATANFGEGGIKVDVPDVTEGNSATITVTASAAVAGGASLSDRTVAVEITLPTPGVGDDTREDQDAQFNPGGSVTTVTLILKANGDVGDEPMTDEVSGTVSLQTTHDPDAEDENVVLTVDVTGGLSSNIAPKSTTIEDDETQTYVFNVTTKEPTEDSTVDLTLRADPAHVDDSVVLTLHLDDPKYRHDQIAAVTINAETPQGGAPIVITTPESDGNRVEDSVTLTAYSGAVGRAMERASVTIDVADANSLPAVAAMVVDKDGKALDPQPTSVTEGDSIMVAVMPVDKDGKVIPAKEKLTVALTSTGTADAADYTLVGAFTIEDEAEASNRVELEVRADEDVGMETLAFDATVSGDSKTGPGTRTSAGVLSLGIEDGTATKITPAAEGDAYPAIMAAINKGAGDEGLNPEETVTVMTSALFTLADGYTASYGASVEGDSVSVSTSGETVTINALKAGESKITVTGTARMASSSFIPSQSVSNVAEVTFPVMVEDTPLVVTLSADPMEIEAGGTTMITATAKRAVTDGDGAVTIDLTVVGDGTLDAESITIAMGDMSGSVMLTANESVTVVATGSGVSGLMQVMVTVTAAPEPVPALPLLGQLALMLSLLGGGVWMYRRRQGLASPSF